MEGRTGSMMVNAESLQQKCEDLKTELQGHEQQNEQLKQEMHDYEIELKDSNAYYETLGTQITTLEVDINTIKENF